MLYDLLVIGSGIAGLRAAIEGSQRGLRVALLSKGAFMRSNSSLACGGINAALGNAEPDSPLVHLEDTLRGGDGLALKEAAQILCQEAPAEIGFLASIGVAFDQQDERIAQRAFGGMGKKRTCHIGDKTGGAITQTLFRVIMQKYPIHWIKERMLLSLLVHEGVISGITALNRQTSEIELLGAKAVVLASGGYGGIYHEHHTNTPEITGDGQAAALRAGLRLSNMEFVQFHPTTLPRTHALISEAARGEGGILINESGERFIDELLTRDKLARKIAKELSEGRRVFLDVRHLGEALLARKLPSLLKIAMSEGINPIKEPIPIIPSVHYSMGGIECDLDGATAIKGLYVAGEVACNLVHGANRLGGNSLLESAVFGRIAGENAAKFAQSHDYHDFRLEPIAKDTNLIEHILGGENRYNFQSIRKTLGKTLYEKAGIFRTQEGLHGALDYVSYLKRIWIGCHCIHKQKEYNSELQAILELRNMLEVSEAMLLSALAREESRGAHYREDFPEKDEKLFGTPSFVKKLESGRLYMEFEPKEGAKGWLDRLKKRLTR